MPEVGNTQVLTGVTMSLSTKLTFELCCLWSTSPQLLIAHRVGTGIAVKHTETIVTLKCWKLADRKFTEKFGSVVDLAKVEVGVAESTWT